MKPKRSMDLTTGPILKKLILFVLPLLASNLLQHFYHAADQIVVGQFAENGKMALAAIGTTGSATNLMEGMRRAMSFGIPEAHAVRAATWNPACAIGASHLAGSIETGKPADFIVCRSQYRDIAVYLRGNPL